MSALYTIYLIVISAITGDVIEEYVASPPMTLEECNRTLIEKGPIPVHEDKAVFGACRKIEPKVSV